MLQRVTIMLEQDIVAKLRIIQSKKISKLKEHVSFSCVINDELKKVLK